MKILIVDDHDIFLYGLLKLIEGRFDSAEILTATHVKSALEIIQSTSQIDLLIIDIGMPVLDGCALLQLINEHHLIIPACVISATENIKQIQQALELGAMAFIPKAWDSNKILSGIESVLQGEYVVPDEIQIKLHALEKLQNDILLSKRQKDVLLLLKDGHSNKQIADILNITEHTVKSHISALFQIFDASRRMECIESAKKFGII